MQLIQAGKPFPTSARPQSPNTDSGEQSNTPTMGCVVGKPCPPTVKGSSAGALRPVDCPAIGPASSTRMSRTTSGQGEHLVCCTYALLLYVVASQLPMSQALCMRATQVLYWCFRTRRGCSGKQRGDMCYVSCDINCIYANMQIRLGCTWRQSPNVSDEVELELAPPGNLLNS